MHASNFRPVKRTADGWQEIAWDEAFELVVCNPPYGHRVGKRGPLRDLHAQLGHVLRDRWPGARVALLCGDELWRHCGLPLQVARSLQLVQFKVAAALLALGVTVAAGVFRAVSAFWDSAVRFRAIAALVMVPRSLRATPAFRTVMALDLRSAGSVGRLRDRVRDDRQRAPPVQRPARSSAIASIRWRRRRDQPSRSLDTPGEAAPL